jgi:Putative prokaryotic signal transducing protein
MGVKGWSVIFKGERLQAELIAAVLEADGIQVEVFGDNAYGVGIDLTEARLMVPEDQAEAARGVIRAAEEAPIPPDDEDGQEEV